jgi:hypothetical protein
MDAFRCGLPGTVNDTTLCFHASATCAVDEYGEYCVCPSGFIADFTSGHFRNCVLPTWFLPAFFAFNTAGCLLAGFRVGSTIGKLRSEVKTFAMIWIAVITSHWLGTLCLFLQNGLLTPGWVMQTLSTIVFTRLSVVQMKILTRPLFAVLRKPTNSFEKGMESMYFSSVIVSGSLGATLAVFASDAARIGILNFVFMVYIYIMSFFYFIPVGLALVYMKRLRREIMRLQNNVAVSGTSWEDFMVRLDTLEGANFIIGCSGFFLFIPAVVLSIIGSIPYQFVIACLLQCSLWPTYPLFMKILGMANAREKKFNDTMVPSQVAVTKPHSSSADPRDSYRH